VKSNPSDYLRNRLKRLEEYFGIQTHEDFRVPFEFLRPAEVAAAQRVFIEASWNAVKLTRRPAPLARDPDGRLRRYRAGPRRRTRVRRRRAPAGLGLRYMRRCAEEVGAELDVISAPGPSTTIQLRFDYR
jgi:hypothetical protein